VGGAATVRDTLEGPGIGLAAVGAIWQPTHRQRA
jgi:hypothetical protein